MESHNTSLVVDAQQLYRSFGHREALKGLDLQITPGSCHGIFGRNGAGKTTTVLCLLNLLRLKSGSIKVFGLDLARHETAIKSRLAYLPDSPSFYPWMTVRQVLDYFASFRERWDYDMESRLLKERFQLDPRAKAQHLSKGEKSQLALACALCASPELLILDEPISGLDPLVRGDLLESVIGDFMAAEPGRTVLIATHLIREVEGLISSFTVVENGKTLLQEDAQSAKQRYRAIRLEFASEPPETDIPDLIETDRMGKTIEMISSRYTDDIEQRLKALEPKSMDSRGLALEEIFVWSQRLEGHLQVGAQARSRRSPIMNPRIKNELRPALGVPLISWIVAALLAAEGSLGGFFARATFLFGFCWLVAHSMGRDLQTGRFQWSLAQPISRSRLLAERLMIWVPLGLAAGLVHFVANPQAPNLWLLAQLSVLGLALTILFALSQHRASLALGAGLSVVLALDLLMTQSETAGFGARYIAPMLLPGSLLALGSAFWAMHRYQAVSPTGSASGHIGSLSAPNLRASSAVIHMLRKELRLQRAALWPVLGALILWLPAFVMDWPLVRQVSVLIALLLSPMLAASSAMAEERRWGTLPMQLSLPASRQLQWLCKWVVGIALCTLSTAVAYGLAGPEWTIWIGASSFEAWWQLGLLTFALTMVASKTSTEPIVAFAHGVVLCGALYATKLLIESAASLVENPLPFEDLLALPILALVTATALWLPDGQSWRLPWSKPILYFTVAAVLSVPALIQLQSLQSMQEDLDAELVSLSRRVDMLPSSEAARAEAKSRNLIVSDTSTVSDLLPRKEDRMRLSGLTRRSAKIQRADQWLSRYGGSWVSFGRTEAIAQRSQEIEDLMSEEIRRSVWNLFLAISKYQETKEADSATDPPASDPLRRAESRQQRPG